MGMNEEEAIEIFTRKYGAIDAENESIIMEKKNFTPEEEAEITEIFNTIFKHAQSPAVVPKSNCTKCLRRLKNCKCKNI